MYPGTLETSMTEPVALLKEYIRIDTSNPPGDCRVAADLLCRVLREDGHSPVTFGSRPEKPNVLCHVGGTEEPGLLLVHHMDVVPARAEEWSVPPFSAEERDGFLYGRGTLDTKGLGVAHWCAALRAAREGILRRKLFLVANADEEVGGAEGAEYFVRNLPYPLGKAYGLNEGGIGVTDIFGPGGKFFLLNMWEKGPLWLRLLATGRAGHGSRPSPRDATARLARAMARVAEHRDPPRLSEPVREMLRALRAKGYVDLDVDALRGGAAETEALEALAKRFPEIDPLFRNTFAVTMISAGFKPNVIPATAEGTVDGRLVPGEEPEEAAARVRELVSDLDVSVEVLFSERPNGSPMGPLYRAMEEAILSVHPDAAVVPYLSTGFTDSRFFRSIGIPTYGLMPVLLPRAEHGKIHGVDERIPLSGIAEMTEIVHALIVRWNQNSTVSPFPG
jgi:acetylornithine deacetylase/succinyl-diaminopimelate desuccinylase-like protein